MDQEIEVKFLIADFAALKRKISSLELPCLMERVHELNLRYDQADGRLLAQRQVLRLRKDHNAILTFKGPGVMTDDVLLRKEIEFEVSDYEAAQRLLGALGYQVIMIYEKYRANYLIGQVTLSVDETPFGLFIELEGNSPAEVHQAAERLALDWDRRINQSYSALLRVYNQNAGTNFRDLTFENFSGLEISPAFLELSFGDSPGELR